MTLISQTNIEANDLKTSLTCNQRSHCRSSLKSYKKEGHQCCSDKIFDKLKDKGLPNNDGKLNQDIAEKLTKVLEGFVDVISSAIKSLIQLPYKEATLPAPNKNEGLNTPAPSNTSGKQVKNKLETNGEFLWKPVSEKDGKLAVLIPSKFAGKIKSLNILDSQTEKVLAKGKYSGNANGGRDHFRFNKSGAAFPDGAVVQIILNNGKEKFIKIPETSERFQK